MSQSSRVKGKRVGDPGDKLETAVATVRSALEGEPGDVADGLRLAADLLGRPPYLKRRWFGKVEYSWTHTGYGTVVGWAWTKGQARRRGYKAVFELMHPPGDTDER